MLRRSILLLLCCAGAHCGENDFFIAERGGESVCVTNSSFALSWTNFDVKPKIGLNINPVSTFIPLTEPNSFDCDIQNDLQTDTYFVQTPWKLENSLELVLDRRWEEFDTKTTTYNYYGDLDYLPLVSISGADFDIFLSLRTQNEAHVFLCDGEFPPEANCYWLMLQAFSGKKSALRKCRSNSIPRLGQNYPSDESCRRLRIEVEHPAYPTYLSDQKWTHLEVRKKGKTLECYRVGQNLQEKIFGWQDGDPIRVTNMIVHSKQVAAWWKIHKLNFIHTVEETDEIELGPALDAETDSLCVSMLISMCRFCKIKLALTTYDETIVEKIYDYEKRGWTQVRLVAKNVPQFSEIQLLVTTISKDPNRFWKIDSVRVCNENEFRIIRLKGKGNCQLMENDATITTNNTTVALGSTCPEDAFGPFCVPCQWIFDGRCKTVKICTGSQCVCSPGFDPKHNCFYPCTGRFYGHGCLKPCGKCSGWLNPCDHVDGTCHVRQCIENYSGPKCDIPPTISFSEPPKILSVTNTAATVTVTNFKLENYFRNNRPETYTIQYKKAEREDPWKAVPTNFQFNENATITIDNLEPDTLYSVRSVIIAENNKPYDGPHVKTSNFSTNCEDITEKNVDLKVSNTSVEVFLANTTKANCALKSYKMSVRDNKRVVDFNNLTPFTNYTIFLERKSTLLEKSFQTSESVPTQIEEVRAINVSSSSVTLQWKQQSLIHGQFKYYIVEYQHVSYAACNSTLTTSTRNRRNVKENVVILSNLIPFSQYSVSVATANTKYTGPFRQTIVTTSSLHDIKTEEVPSVKFTSEANVVTFSTSTITCARLRGPLFLKLTINCTSQWCKPSDTAQFQQQWPFSKISFTQAIPYTNYQADFKFCRNSTHCGTSLQKRNFTTEPSVPSSVTDLLVYSKNESSISLRWKPPYPPNGILEAYKIQYGEFRLILAKTPCQLWPEFHCVTLSKLEKSKRYSVAVSARNKNPDGFGASKVVEAVTQTEKSKAPYDLRITWSLNNDLELEWKHPNQTNGEIKFFTVATTAAQKEQIVVRRPVTEEALTYFYKVKSTELVPSTFYSILVSANNGFEGETASIADTSPPTVPHLVVDPKVTISSDTISVDISPEIYNRMEENTYGLVLLVSDCSTKEWKIQQLEELVDQSRPIYTSRDFTKKVSVRVDKASASSTTGKYEVLVIVKNSALSKSSYKIYCLSGSTSTPNFALLALLLLLLIIPVVIIFLKRQKVKSYFKKKTPTEGVYSMDNVVTKQKDHKLEHDKTYENACVLDNTVYSKAIDVGDFREYVERTDSTKELAIQHDMILNIRNSVTYVEIRDNEYFDYVDMEFSNDTVSKAYITAECPKLDFVATFWKNIWDENARHVILLTSPSNPPIEKYYPDKDEKMEYHSISIQLAFSKVVSNYEHKTFILIKNDEIRHVNQISFSYQGLNPLQFVPLFKKLLTFPLLSGSPIFVHSNGDTEKVGFVLLCDMSLRMADRENRVDVWKNLKLLADHKSDLVCNVEMYKLAHLIILEIICNGDYEAVVDTEYENF